MPTQPGTRKGVPMTFAESCGQHGTLENDLKQLRKRFEQEWTVKKGSLASSL